jgi:REP element-mobilizing transposase RayT
MPTCLKRFQQTNQLHFITFSCYKRQPFLRTQKAKNTLQQILEQTRNHQGLHIAAYGLMPEHVHLLTNEPATGILDEMGYLSLDSFAATCLFQLVSERYEKGSIILTSNKSYGDWGAIFSDNVIASAILDRLLHHSSTINIKGESYPLKDKKKAGVVAAKLPGKDGA